MDAAVDQAGQVCDVLRRLHSGDASARNDLLRLVYDRLLASVSRSLRHFPRVHRWEESSDVLQEVLIRLDRALNQVQVTDANHFFALSSTLIRRELIDLSRQYYGPQGAGANCASYAPGPSESFVAPGENTGNESQEPGRLAMWTEFHLQVEHLPKPLRDVVNLLWYQDLSQEQAAAVLNVSTKTVGRRWLDARIRLGQSVIL